MFEGFKVLGIYERGPADQSTREHCVSENQKPVDKAHLPPFTVTRSNCSSC